MVTLFSSLMPRPAGTLTFSLLRKPATADGRRPALRPPDVDGHARLRALAGLFLRLPDVFCPLPDVRQCFFTRCHPCLLLTINVFRTLRPPDRPQPVRKLLVASRVRTQSDKPRAASLVGGLMAWSFE